MNIAKYNHSKKFTYVIFVLIFILISVALLIKPIMKNIYPLKFENYISKYSTMYGIDKYLVMGIISSESKFDENAVSHKAAKGLMQLKDETAKWCIENFNIKETSDPSEMNISIGCAYINYLIDKYKGNTLTALAAYNAGEGNVTRWLKEQGSPPDKALGDIPFGETEKYVTKVLQREKVYRFLYS